MPFDWSDYRVLAKAINDNPSFCGTVEAAYRTVASRAYYAAFHSAVDVACGFGFQPTGSPNDHFDVSVFLKRLPKVNDSGKKIAAQLTRLRDHRNNADYRDELKRTPQHLASQALSMADVVFAETTKIRQGQ